MTETPTNVHKTHLVVILFTKRRLQLVGSVVEIRELISGIFQNLWHACDRLVTIL